MNQPTTFRIAVVEYCPIQRELIAFALKKVNNLDFSLYASPEELLNAPTWKPNLLILDFHWTDQRIDLLDHFQGVPFIVFTHQDRLEWVVDLFRQGACGYIAKGPGSFEELIALIQEITDHQTDLHELKQLRKKNRKTLLELALAGAAVLGGLGVILW